MWRHSLHVSGFFYALRKPPAGRVGAYRIRPPTRPDIWGECVFLVFKHRFIVIQTRFKRHSNSALRAVGEGRQGRQPSWPGASGMPAKKAGYMWRHSLHVSGFFMPAEASGRQGRGVSHTPSHTPRYKGRMRVPRVQAPFKRHSNSALRAVGEGVCDTPLLRYAHHVPGFLRRRPASAEAGKLAGYLKSPYQANFAGVRRRPPASADAPRIGASETRAGAAATARAAAPRAATRAAAAAAP